MLNLTCVFKRSEQVKSRMFCAAIIRRVSHQYFSFFAEIVDFFMKLSVFMQFAGD